MRTKQKKKGKHGRLPQLLKLFLAAACRRHSRANGVLNVPACPRFL
jgi:hypothetical protein